jgi:hypothetical protein
MSEKKLEGWQAFGRDVANLRAKLLELEGAKHIKRGLAKPWIHSLGRWRPLPGRCGVRIAGERHRLAPALRFAV